MHETQLTKIVSKQSFEQEYHNGEGPWVSRRKVDINQTNNKQTNKKVLPKKIFHVCGKARNSTVPYEAISFQ